MLDKDDQIENNGFSAGKAGRERFRARFFAYNAKDYVLKDINFRIEPEKRSPSSEVPAREDHHHQHSEPLLRDTKGSIKIDGVDIRDYELPIFLRRIAIVLQDVFPLSGSVLKYYPARFPLYA